MKKNNLLTINFNKKNIFIAILMVNAFIFYILERILFNPLLLWTLLPLYIGYTIVIKAWKIKSKKKLWEGYNFLIASVGFSYLYHFPWFFDWDGARTGSSTAAIIFIWGPIWAILFGYIGYFAGSFTKDENPSST